MRKSHNLYVIGILISMMFCPRNVMADDGHQTVIKMRSGAKCKNEKGEPLSPEIAPPVPFQSEQVSLSMIKTSLGNKTCYLHINEVELEKASSKTAADVAQPSNVKTTGTRDFGE